MPLSRIACTALKNTGHTVGVVSANGVKSMHVLIFIRALARVIPILGLATAGHNPVTIGHPGVT